MAHAAINSKALIFRRFSRPINRYKKAQVMDPELIKATVNQIMPFGKYAGRRLFHLPEPYLVWFHKQGFPKGKLGEQLALMYEIKLNGLESVVEPLLNDD